MTKPVTATWPYTVNGKKLNFTSTFPALVDLVRYVYVTSYSLSNQIFYGATKHFRLLMSSLTNTTGTLMKFELCAHCSEVRNNYNCKKPKTHRDCSSLLSVQIMRLMFCFFHCCTKVNTSPYNYNTLVIILSHSRQLMLMIMADLVHKQVFSFRL